MRPVLLLPGSRGHEIELLLPPMLGAAVKLLAAKPDTHFSCRWPPAAARGK